MSRHHRILLGFDRVVGAHPRGRTSLVGWGHGVNLLGPDERSVYGAMGCLFLIFCWNPLLDESQTVLQSVTST